MASVDICYMGERTLPAEIRMQVESLAQARILTSSKLCIAMFGEHLLGVVSFRPSKPFARIDFLHIEEAHRPTKLAEILLNHALKQMHKEGILEVNAAVLSDYLRTFVKAGFLEENITIPGMHADSRVTELVHPNIEQLKPRFELIGDSKVSNSSDGPANDASESKAENRSIAFDTLGSFRDLTRMVLCNAQRRIYLLCQSLEDPAINDPQVVAHMRDLVLNSQQVEIRLILEDDKHRPIGHVPILELAQRLPSFVQIRRIQDKRVTPKEWMYLCDDIHAVERRREHGFKGQAHIESPLTLQRLSYQFENLWQHSVPSSQLRRLAM